MAASMLALTAFFAVLYYYLLAYAISAQFFVAIGLAIVSIVLADLTTDFIANAPKPTIDPTGKAVFITGCDTGFGHALAKKLDALGFWVYAGCLMLPDDQGAKQLRDACSDRMQIVKLDVTNDEQVEAAAKHVESTLDGKVLWSLVNNAGIGIFSEVEWCNMETYKKFYDVNALGPTRVTKAFLPLLRKSRGRVIILASTAGRYTLPGLSAYSMSKFAAIAFADALRMEMKKWNISVHTVEPFLYKTPIAEENRLLSTLQGTWEASSSDIRELYGQRYYKAFQKYLHNLLKMSFNNINEVVNDLADAVAAQRPKIRYVPNFIIHIIFKVVPMVPIEIQDCVTHVIQPKSTSLPDGRQL